MLFNSKAFGEMLKGAIAASVLWCVVLILCVTLVATRKPVQLQVGDKTPAQMEAWERQLEEREKIIEAHEALIAKRQAREEMKELDVDLSEEIPTLTFIEEPKW